MLAGRLTPLQRRLLGILAGVAPALTLSGGAALAGLHTKHRDTRDLDLFLQQERELGAVPTAVQQRLEAAGLTVTLLEHASAFCRLAVTDGEETVRVDLVADPVPLAELPRAASTGDATILVDTAHQILVNKLCALLSRSELRDLWDVQVLLEAGGDLRRALLDAPNQDAGFSPLTFSWTLQQLPLRRLAGALAWPDQLVVRLELFRAALVDRVLADAVPQ